MTLPRVLEEGILDLAIGKFEKVALTFEKLCESPIEVAFAVALAAMIDGTDKKFHITQVDEKFSAFAAIMPQMRIGQYRVDFLVALSRYPRRAIVECDGRDFHHSTRDQIERDRKRDAALEADGYKVFRFPGTQIHNDPFGCAEQVIMWLIDSPRFSG